MAKSSLIGRIAFDLVANTGKLISPLKKAETSVASFASKAKMLFAAAGPIAAGIAAIGVGFLSVKGTIDGVVSAVQRLGNLSDESRRLGVPAEMLSALQYAAQQAGIEVSSLGTALQYMMKKGYSVNDIEKIADAIDKVKDPVKKMQMVLKYFGKSGAGMLNLFAGGAAELRKMMQEARDTGYVVTQKEADGLEKAGDAWERIKLASQGVFNTIAIQLAPYIDLFANAMVKAVIAINKAIRQTGESIFDAWVYPVGFFMDTLTNAYALILRLQISLLDLMTLLPEGGVFGGLAAGARAELDALAAEPSWIDKLRDWAKEMRKSFWGSVGGAPFGSFPSLQNEDRSPLLKGSSEAFSAILKSSKEDLDKRMADDLAAIRRDIDHMDARGFVMGPAVLGSAIV